MPAAWAVATRSLDLETLARRFGVSRERICQLEASGKRKIAAALANEGYAEFAGGEPIRLPPTRARRRRLKPDAAEGAQMPKVAVAAV